MHKTLAKICLMLAVMNRWADPLTAQPPIPAVDDEMDDDLPEEAAELIRVFETESQQIRAQADKEIGLHRETAIQLLNRLQAEYTEEERMDEAVAVREKIRELRVEHLKPLPNPGNLMKYAQNVGETYYFDVTGKLTGSIWGTDTYTADSQLATAAVHAGVLKPGQRGMVRVTIVKSPDIFQGTERNGIMTHDYGRFAAAYKVRRPLASDVNTRAVAPLESATEATRSTRRSN